MNRLAPLTCLLVGASLAASAAAQTSVVSTRTFTHESFDLTAGTGSFSGRFTLDGLGLNDHFYTHGVPSLVEIQLDVEWDIDLMITNQLAVDTRFDYATTVDMLPTLGDCAGYAGRSLHGSTQDVAPGATGALRVSRVDTFAWTGPTFFTACQAPWRWENVAIWTDPFTNDPLTDSGGAPIPPGWIQTHQARAIVNGEVRITWAPNPLPFQTVCAGTAMPAVTLAPYGGVDFRPNVYLFQEGAPMSTNLLVEADQASGIVLPSGLCVGGTIRRVPGSLNQGGVPFRLTQADALIGTTTYFQSWFRTGAATSDTSECIEVTFP